MKRTLTVFIALFIAFNVSVFAKKTPFSNLTPATPYAGIKEFTFVVPATAQGIRQASIQGCGSKFTVQKGEERAFASSLCSNTFTIQLQRSDNSWTTVFSNFTLDQKNHHISVSSGRAEIYTRLRNSKSSDFLEIHTIPGQTAVNQSLGQNAYDKMEIRLVNVSGTDS